MFNKNYFTFAYFYFYTAYLPLKMYQESNNTDVRNLRIKLVFNILHIFYTNKELIL